MSVHSPQACYGADAQTLNADSHVWVLAHAPALFCIPQTLNTSERALERDGEEPDAVHAAAARGGDHRGQEAQDTQDHQLDQAGHQHSLLRICIKAMRIRLLTLMRIRVRFPNFHCDMDPDPDP